MEFYRCITNVSTFVNNYLAPYCPAISWELLIVVTFEAVCDSSGVFKGAPSAWLHSYVAITIRFCSSCSILQYYTIQ